MRLQVRMATTQRSITMTRDEKRAIRRDWINFFLQHGATSVCLIGYLTRAMENSTYGFELSIYGGVS